MKFTIYIVCILAGMNSFSQAMTNEKLLQIITAQSDSISGTPGSWELVYKGVQMLCITDEKNNRMRIIAPITQAAEANKELLFDALTANFHSALDVKYAIANEIIWSAFVHPLASLQKTQLESALSQVYLAKKNFGTTFNSTDLFFGIDQKKNKKKSVKKPEFQRF